MSQNHQHYMAQALALAREAYNRGDWPTAALVVKDDVIVGTGQNRQITRTDVTWHAETDAIRDATSRLDSSDLSGATLYTPMEPCPMCAFAIRMSGMRRVVVALRHATIQRTDLGDFTMERFGGLVHWEFELISGVMEEDYLSLRLEWKAQQEQLAQIPHTR
jgi:tRNA(adenine34) deaminase